MTDPVSLQKARDLVARRQELLGRMRALLIESLRVRREPDEIDPDTPLFATGLGLDSVDAVELVVCLETEFGVRMSDDAELRRKTRTVNGVIDAVLEKEAAHAG